MLKRKSNGQVLWGHAIFGTRDEATFAMKLDKFYMGKRYIELFQGDNLYQKVPSRSSSAIDPVSEGAPP